LNTIDSKKSSVRPEPVEGQNRLPGARQTRSWFDKLTTNEFAFERAAVKRNILWVKQKIFCVQSKKRPAGAARPGVCEPRIKK
jgi:hypothetical protein